VWLEPDWRRRPDRRKNSILTGTGAGGPACAWLPAGRRPALRKDIHRREFRSFHGSARGMKRRAQQGGTEVTSGRFADARISTGLRPVRHSAPISKGYPAPRGAWRGHSCMDPPVPAARRADRTASTRTRKNRRGVRALIARMARNKGDPESRPIPCRKLCRPCGTRAIVHRPRGIVVG